MLLVFTVLAFVLALRPMAQSLADYLLHGGTPGLDMRGIAELFRIYGAGFAIMCTVTMALHLQGSRRSSEPRHMRGRAIIYGLFAAGGTVSFLLTLAPRAAMVSPWICPVVALAVGLFASLYDWSERPDPGTASEES